MGKKKGTGNANELETILGGAADTGHSGSKKKKIIIAAVALVLVAAIVVASVIIVKKKKSNTGETVYREYTAERGDILTGLTESSVITLNKENVTFPVGAEVLEVYVKSGAEVQEGDPLVKMSTEDIADAISEYETEISNAATEIENQKLNRENELEKAQSQMESSILTGSQSEDKYAQDVEQAEISLSDSESNVATAQSNLDDLTAQSKTFTQDYAMLTYYENKVETCQTTYDFWSNRNDSYNSVQSEIKLCEEDISTVTKEIEELDAEDAEEKYNNGEITFAQYLKAENKLTELASLKTKLNNLNSELSLYDKSAISKSLSTAEENLNDAKSTYEDYRTSFQTTYGNISTQAGMNKAVSEAQTALTKAELDYEKQKTAYDTALLTAEQTKSSSKLASDNAEKTYALKKAQLDQQVSEAEENYETLVENLAEIKESLSNDGVVSAPCSGIVSSMNVEEGDEVTAGSGEDSILSMLQTTTLLTITDMSEVYVSVSISEDEILEVSLDQEAVVSLSAFPDETFDGVVDSISVEGATMGAATVTYTVNVKFTQEGHELYDGMSADVTLIEGSARDVIYVSKQAVTTEDGKSYVNLKGSDGEPVKTQVSTGFTDGQYMEITSGLNEGDTVLVVSALGGGNADSSAGGGNMPDMGDFDAGDMSMPDMSNMPAGGMGGAPQ